MIGNYVLNRFLQFGLYGTCRENLKTLLEDCAQLQGYKVQSMRIWRIFLSDENGSFVLPFYTLEECVKNSDQPFCLYCQSAGWSHHFVSKRKYHFIIPIDNEWNKPIKDGVLDLKTHILHGLIHCNGFGHLLCINGIEGGSNFIRGREVMDLWDRICTTLHTRKISVVDVSKKRKMDLRLLYGISYGDTWFGRWDYKFCHGNFGVTKVEYEVALQILSTLKLNNIIQDLKNGSIKETISLYSHLSHTQLATIRDLFQFMLSLTLKEKQASCIKFSILAAKLNSRWHVRLLKVVAKFVVDAIKEKKSKNRNGISREEARLEVSKHIKDMDLIDYVLEWMNNVIVGGYVVWREVNSTNGALEYSLQEPEETDRVDSVIPKYKSGSKSDVYRDLTILYYHLFVRSVSNDLVKVSVGTVIDSKNFTKEWPFHDDAGEYLRFICRVIPELNLETTLYKRMNTLREELVVPVHAMVNDLKATAEYALRDTYCIMEDLKVCEIVELKGVDDDDEIVGLLKSGSEISVRCSGVDFLTTSDLKYECGEGTCEVKCKCGARDDDGEHFVECDGCGVWQHSRCIGLPIDHSKNELSFKCDKCSHTTAHKPMPSPYWDIPLDDILFEDNPVRNLDDLEFDVDNLDDLLLGIGDPTASQEQKDQIKKKVQRKKKVQITKKMHTTPREERPRTTPSLEQSTSIIVPQPRKLLLEPYVKLGNNAKQFFFEENSCLYVKHRLFHVEPLSPNFWGSLFGKKENGWLSETHIIIWIQLLLERCPQGERWTIFSPYFFNFLAQQQQDWTDFALGNSFGQTKGNPWWAVDVVYIPINIQIGNFEHWILGEFLLKTLTLNVYDSLLSRDSFEWLRSEGKFTKFEEEVDKIFHNIDYWRKVGLQPKPVRVNFVSVVETPQQSGVLGDCGVWLCLILERLASWFNLDIPNATDEVALTFRYRMSSIFFGSYNRYVM